MKRMFFLAALSAMCLASCKQVIIDTPDTTGTLSLNVVNETDYITVVTKSGSDTENGPIDYENTADYDVVVDGPTKLNMKYSEFAGNVIKLGSGTYTITVTSPRTLPAAFEQPIYQAKDEFVINAGEVTPLDLVCTPANCKVTIRLSPNFVKELATYEVTVNNGLAEPLVWTKNGQTNDFAAGSVDEDGYLISTKAGYFLPRGLEIQVKGHRSIDDKVATAIYYIEDPQPAEHHIIKLDADVTGQIGGISIKVVDTFNPVNQEINIPGLDESYVDRPDDFGNGDSGEEVSTSPSIVWQTNPFFEPLEISTSSKVEMTIKAPLGFETFMVTVSDNFKGAIGVITKATKICQKDENGDIIFNESTDADGQVVRTPAPLEGEGAGTLAGVDYIDLINHPEAWYSFNLPVGTQVKGNTEIVFDLSPFIPTLCQTADGMTVTFNLLATDVNGESVLTTSGEIPVVTLIVPKAE